MKHTFLFAAVGLLFAGLGWNGQARSGPPSGYKVLAPIRQGNLTVFPIVAGKSHDTGQFLTLDEGLRSGEVVITEAGSIHPMVRRGSPLRPYDSGGAQVNQLMLVNNSKRPLLLLAGEVVTGGKQDRIIGKDRLVPAESDPIDLGVFCVEPGRWVATSSKFAAPPPVTGFVAPSVRSKAMADKDQAKVWSQVRGSQGAMVAGLPAATRSQVESTTSYATVMQNAEVQKRLDAVAAPMETSYRSVIKQLKDQNAVGVVVAVNGQIVWADVFASTELLQKYWPKLVRSYAADAVATEGRGKQPTEAAAQAFLDQMQGRHETVESEPGLYRHTEITGNGFKAFELTSLLPKTGFDVHITKMAD